MLGKVVASSPFEQNTLIRILDLREGYNEIQNNRHDSSTNLTSIRESLDAWKDYHDELVHLSSLHICFEDGLQFGIIVLNTAQIGRI